VAARAHHTPPPPAALQDAYDRLHAAAEDSPRVSAGRDVLEHGRPADGRLSWALVRAEAERLWLALHPALERAHATLLEPRAPDWWVAMTAPLRECEAGGNYATDTGNGYAGAYQFDWSTWAGVGGTGNPAHASPAEQDYRAWRLWSARGFQPWPACGARLAGG
jgi:hypothetical protein